MNDKALKLNEIICQVYDRVLYTPDDEEDWKPNNNITYCNKVVSLICAKFHYTEFHGLYANQIIAKIKVSANWIEVTFGTVQSFANHGFLVIAGETGVIKGHVAVIRPGKEAYSIKWGKFCPVCINVGEKVSISKGINWAFNAIPRFWALIE